MVGHSYSHVSEMSLSVISYHLTNFPRLPPLVIETEVPRVHILKLELTLMISTNDRLFS
jgi:hypothetical protein